MYELYITVAPLKATENAQTFEVCIAVEVVCKDMPHNAWTNIETSSSGILFK